MMIKSSLKECDIRNNKKKRKLFEKRLIEASWYDEITSDTIVEAKVENKKKKIMSDEV